MKRMLLGGYLVLGILKNRKAKNLKVWPKPFILGHRGARAEVPENTIAAFLRAHELLADGVEFDVSLSKDEIPVVIHDQTVNRTTDGVGLVKDLTVLELQKLKSKPLNGFITQGVPTLEEVMKSLPDGFIVNVELKFSGNYSKREFIDAVMPTLALHQERLKIIISSFDGELLSILRENYPKILISLILSTKDKHWPKSLNYLALINPEGIHLSLDLLSPLILRLIRAAGLKVGVWTINDKSIAQKLWAMKIDGIFTDQVGKIVKALRYSS